MSDEDISPVLSDTDDYYPVEGDCASEQNVCVDVGLDSEEIKQRDFQIHGWGCTQYHRKACTCSTVVIWKVLLSYRLSCIEKNKEELDMIIKFQLFNQRHSGSLTVGNKRKRKEREKPRQTYYVAGNIVWRSVCVLH